MRYKPEVVHVFAETQQNTYHHDYVQPLMDDTKAQFQRDKTGSDSMNINDSLISHINQISEGNSTYWAFHGKSKREHAHSYFQYPAMMVPKMQGQLIDAVLQVAPETKHVFDPFVGSGTVMTESMFRGLNFKGRDINPLAILLCKAKSQAFNISLLENDYGNIQSYLEEDLGTEVDIHFKGINKWFREDVLVNLSKIRRAILKIEDLNSRRFFWVALAETVRLNSNSRTSNFKLYTYTQTDIISKEFPVTSTFKNAYARNIGGLRNYLNYLQNKGYLENNNYIGEVEIELGDTKKPQEGIADKKFDLLVTSPPYGDNSTTVTYGQYSYLPLQWITLEDIDPLVSTDFLASTNEIDRRSLGGSLKDTETISNYLKEISPSVRRILSDLKDAPLDRTKRVVAFCRDLDLSLDRIIAEMKPGAFMIWTVGNRKVGGKQVPMDAILEELLSRRGCHIIEKLFRPFPLHSKRMENLTNTMDSERVLIMRVGH